MVPGVCFFWRESIVRVFFVFVCSSCVLGWFVGTGIEFVRRRTREMLINSNRSISFSIMLDTKGDSLFSE